MISGAGESGKSTIVKQMKWVTYLYYICLQIYTVNNT